MLENKDEREKVDEPSHDERPLAPFRRSPLPLPELRPTPTVVGPKLPLRRRPQQHQHPIRLPRHHHRCHPRGGGGGRHPHHFCRHPHDCGPRGRDLRCVAVSPGFVLPTLPPGFGQTTGSGSSSWAISRALTNARSGRLSSVWHRAYNPRESKPLPLKGRQLAAMPASLTRGGRRPFPPPRSPTLGRSLPPVQTP